MKRCTGLFLVFLVVVLAGCQPQKEKPAIKINDVEISAVEFNAAYDALSKLKGETLPRQEFLDTYISRKLILLEAEKLGLDKDPQFLQDLQIFWEQSLLKLMLSRKINELSLPIRVEEEEIKAFYDKHKDTDFKDKELAKVYDQVKVILFKFKQRMALNDWTEQLRKKAAITVEPVLLDIPQTTGEGR